MDSNKVLYKLWLNIVCGHEPQLIDKCIKTCGTAEEIFKSDELYKKMFSCLRMGYKLKCRRTLEQANQLYGYCEQNGIDIITQEDKEYPKRLLEMYAPPQILYVKGEMPDLNNFVCVTIVGSRESSDYSREFANKLAFDLAKSGVVVISGMAKGIDASAHKGTLDAGGITVAILAGGVDVVYPKENASIYKRIIKRSAVISERPPQTIGKGSFYKERNRILVGLSNGVVVVEGEQKSGTKLSANWAIEANRDLFAVPGKPTDKNSELPNMLIKQHAILITSAEDIISEYISVYPIELSNGIKMLAEEEEPPSFAEIKEIKPNFDNYDGNEKMILEYLYNSNDAVHIDKIARDCGIPISEIGYLIISLLMTRAIKEYPGEYYSISDSLITLK